MFWQFFSMFHLDFSANFNQNNYPSDRFVRLIYLLCHEEGETGKIFEDGQFQAPNNEPNDIENACRRITIGALLAQYFFQKTIGKSFCLEISPKNVNAKPTVHRFMIEKIDHKALWQLNPRQLWTLVGNQLMNSCLSSEHCKFLAFCSFSRFCSNNQEPGWLPSKQVKGYCSMGGDGLALLSTHCLYTWPTNLEEIETRFKDDRLVDCQSFMNDSDNRDTLSGCFSSTLGAMIHELAHTFNLGHRNEGIMARKFNEINQFFLNHNGQEKWWTQEDLNILRSNPWLIGHVRSHDPKRLRDQQKNFVLQRGILHSKLGLRLIEYRHRENDLALRTKMFDKPIKIIKLDTEFIRNRMVKMFALDQSGNTKIFYDL